MDLIKKYGLYVVRKGTVLYRRAADKDYHEVMFFGFCRYATAGASTQSDIQIWEVTKDFDALFMIKGKNRGEHLLSAIVDIYNYYFPRNPKKDWDFVSIKQIDKERNPLLNKLRNNNVSNWVCSAENLPQMEVCLFKSFEHNQELVRFLNCMPREQEHELEDVDAFDHSYLRQITLEYLSIKNDPERSLIDLDNLIYSDES